MLRAHRSASDRLTEDTVYNDRREMRAISKPLPLCRCGDVMAELVQRH